MNDIDRWKVARQFLTTYDAGAAKQAATMADKLLRQGNTEGCNRWTQIAAAINDLERRTRRPETP